MRTVARWMPPRGGGPAHIAAQPALCELIAENVDEILDLLHASGALDDGTVLEIPLSMSCGLRAEIAIRVLSPGLCATPRSE